MDLTGKYIRATINPAVLTGTKDYTHRVFFNVNKNLFFDKEVNENEIFSDGWF